MMIKKIIKNRKAMTPLMIGIIVAASVLAAFFIIMAATIPLMQKDTEMVVYTESIKGNDTESLTLKFQVISDYNYGTLDSVEVFRKIGDDLVLYGDRSIGVDFNKSQVQLIGVAHLAPTQAAQDAGETNGTSLQFVTDGQYYLRLYFTSAKGLEKQSQDYVFTYQPKT
jgi:hypothetical protein